MANDQYSKDEVGYEHPAKGRQHCSGCKHFEVIGPHHCEIVRGIILPQDWCEKYESK